MISFIFALLAQDVAGKRGHIVTLDHLQENRNLMAGHVFVGSKLVPMTVLFDTMSK